ncbi:hypothetical protein Ancab_009906 [Ancistrocladus abbreviatus]
MFTLSHPTPAKIPTPSLKPSNPSRQRRQPSDQPFRNPQFDEHLLRSRLIHQANVGHLHEAISTLDVLILHDLTPDTITFSLLLKSSIRSRNFDLGKLVHARLAESKVEVDSVLLNSLITLYSKSGDWRQANENFQAMREKRDLVSWSAMISCFVNNGFELKAIQTFIDMLEHSGFCPNEFCFAAVIRACSNVENAWIGEIIHGLVIKSGCFDDICVGCGLIDMYVKGFEDLDSAKTVFDKMPNRNVVAWSLMIARLVQMGCPENAIELFLDMEVNGFKPDPFTLTSVVSACAELGLFSFGKQLHSRVIRSGLVSDACVGCSLVDMYAKFVAYDSLDDSRKAFDQITEPNVMSWTAIITAYVQGGGHDEEAIKLFSEMVEGPVLPNHFTFASVLKACANVSDPCVGEQVYGQAVKLGLSSDNYVGNSLVSMYTQSGKMEEARRAFDVLFEKNLVSYNTIVDGYAKSLNADMAFQLFHQIENTGIGASAFTFTSLLSAASSVGAGCKGELIHARIVKAGFDTNLRVCNALISTYSRCGNIEVAYRIFSEMQEWNVISWTSMITGFAKHGFAKRALELFDQMLGAGIKPNEVTYVSVLSACSHVGMVSEGWKHFDAMYKQYGILPRMEHYACMVDLLGRSGFLVEALDLINSMPLAANALIWRTLLGGCLVHGNMEIGECSAKKVIEQDPHDPAAYTLLSNLYASKGEWEGMVKIRKDMKQKNLNKEAGYSWIEIGNRVHKFYAGDTSHSQSEKIYEELNQLAGRIKEMGYVPHTDVVLHDMEEDEKEHYLLQHSEKLAVVFGLISTSSPKPIRVFKNLRVCEDCHSAIKCISKATGREIIVRDANRFHHFRDGSCSCNDYW